CDTIGYMKKIRNSPEFPILIMNLVNFIALGLVIGRHSLGYELWLAFHIPPFLLFIAIASSAGWLLTKRKTGVIAAVAASFLVLSFYSVLASLSYFAANLFVMVSGVLFYAFNALLEKQ